MNISNPAAHPVNTPAVSVKSETGRLRRVVIGLPDSFVLPDPINKKQEIFTADHPETPTRASLRPEFDGFRAALEGMGVEVHQPSPVAGVPDQLTPRDIGFVIDDTFVVASMATECRREEWRGIESILEGIPPKCVLRAPAGLVLEGGDVIFDRGIIYVGLGERTTDDGAAWLRERFGDRFEIVPVPLHSHRPGEDILHLDCAFVPVGREHALIYAPGFRSMPDAIASTYTFIEVTKEEQSRLATNVLNAGPDHAFSRRSATRVNAALRDIGVEVVELRFGETPKMGGSFRCASLPLVRD